MNKEGEFAIEIRKRIDEGYNFPMLEIKYSNIGLTTSKIKDILNNHYSEMWSKKLIAKAKKNGNYSHFEGKKALEIITFAKLNGKSILYYLTIPANVFIQKIQKNGCQKEKMYFRSQTIAASSNYDQLFEEVCPKDFWLVAYFENGELYFDSIKSNQNGNMEYYDSTEIPEIILGRFLKKARYFFKI